MNLCLSRGVAQTVEGIVCVANFFSATTLVHYCCSLVLYGVDCAETSRHLPRQKWTPAGFPQQYGADKRWYIRSKAVEPRTLEAGPPKQKGAPEKKLVEIFERRSFHVRGRHGGCMFGTVQVKSLGRSISPWKLRVKSSVARRTKILAVQPLRR